ncbi:copine-8 [Anaeramoeba ignava]|uniref:Copine-8 n=1 Tax=Anaeramoeba ignava TaxID=1746090 RepID=A0A9Q0LS46_ANAIG|nr:copine-8 [Anaeramoeba ignava]
MEKIKQKAFLHFQFHDFEINSQTILECHILFYNYETSSWTYFEKNILKPQSNYLVYPQLVEVLIDLRFDQKFQIYLMKGNTEIFGSSVFSLAEIFSEKDQIIEKLFQERKGKINIQISFPNFQPPHFISIPQIPPIEKQIENIHYRFIQELKDVEFQSGNKIIFNANGLKKNSVFGKMKSFLILQKENGDEIGRTGIVEKEINPKWNEMVISIPFDMKSHIYLQCWNSSTKKSSNLIGECKILAEDLYKEGTQFKLINPKKINSKKYDNSGIVSVRSIQPNFRTEQRLLNTRIQFSPPIPFDPNASLFDYILSGFDIQTMFIADFTGFNLDRHSNFHYLLVNKKMNIFSFILHSLVAAISPLNKTKQFPAFYWGNYLTNLSPNKEPFENIEQIETGLNKITSGLKKQTKHQFDYIRVCELACNYPENFNNPNRYLVSIIIIDNLDVDETQMNILRTLFIKASKQPLSIIFIALSQEPNKFKNLQILTNEFNESVLSSSSLHTFQRPFISTYLFSDFFVDQTFSLPNWFKQQFSSLENQVLLFLKQMRTF